MDMEKPFRIGAGRMHLKRKTFRRIKKFGQYSRFLTEPLQMLRTEKRKRMFPQKLRKRTDLALIHNLADAVSRRMIRAPVAFDARSDPVFRKSGVFRFRFAAEAVDSASARVEPENAVVDEFEYFHDKILLMIFFMEKVYSGIRKNGISGNAKIYLFAQKVEAFVPVCSRKTLEKWN